MFRVVESHRVQLAIDGARRGDFIRELLAVPIDRGEVALVRVRADRGTPSRAPVLLVHGFGMNRHTWHLGGRSFAGFLADLDYDVYVLELRGVGRSADLGSHVATHPEEYVLGDLPAALRAATMRSNHERAFAIGHSMGALVIYCAMHDLQHALRGVITLSGVYTLAGGSRLVRLLARLGHRLIPRRVHHAPFAVRALGRMLGRYVDFSDSGLFRTLAPIQAWYPGSIERDLLMQQIRIGWDISSLGVFSALLRTGDVGRVVAPDGRDLLDEMAHVDLPMLVVGASGDSLVAPSDARAAFDRATSSDKTWRCFGPEHDQPNFGHLDLIIGKHAPTHVWPVLQNWLGERADPRAQPGAESPSRSLETA